MTSLIRPVSLLFHRFGCFTVSHHLWVQQSVVHGWCQNPHAIRQISFALRRCLFTRRRNPELHGQAISVSKVSSNLELHRLQRNNNKMEAVGSNKATSLVVLFLPLHKTTTDVRSYCQLYHKHGLEVLTVRGRFKDVLSPSRGHKFSRQVLDYLTNNETPLTVGKYLFHSVSSGDYLCALVLNELKEQPVKYRVTRLKISGHVFDSLSVDATLSRKFFPTGDGIFFAVSERLFRLYLWAFEELGDFHRKVLEAFKRAPLRGNVLLFHSFSNASSKSVDEVIKAWKNDGVTEVAVSSWDNSDRGVHIEQHPQQYARAIDTFIAKINLVPHKTVSKN